MTRSAPNPCILRPFSQKLRVGNKQFKRNYVQGHVRSDQSRTPFETSSRSNLLQIMSDALCGCGVPWKDIDDKCARCKRRIKEDRLEKLPLFRQVEEIPACKCSETVVANWGSRSTNIPEVFLCNFCDSRAEKLSEPVKEEVAEQSSVQESPPKFEVPISGRSAQENLEVVETLLTSLAAAKKYKKAISSGEFALFTLVGTTDWEDYASLSIDALQLLTLAQINTNLEAIRKSLEK